MKFGYYLLNTYVPELDGESPELYARWLEQIDTAEDLGFDSLWVTEHHFRYFGGMMPSPSVLLAAAAQRTRNMRLGAAVSILPMHNPLRIAEEFAMVDLLSNGRVILGAGRGMHPTEYKVFSAGTPLRKDYRKLWISLSAPGPAENLSGAASTIPSQRLRFIPNPSRNRIRRFT